LSERHFRDNWGSDSSKNGLEPKTKPPQQSLRYVLYLFFVKIVLPPFRKEYHWTKTLVTQKSETKHFDDYLIKQELFNFLFSKSDILCKMLKICFIFSIKALFSGSLKLLCQKRRKWAKSTYWDN